VGQQGQRQAPGLHQAVHQAPSEDNIRALTDMGFTRESVLQALQTAQNDVQLATNILLDAN